MTSVWLLPCLISFLISMWLILSVGFFLLAISHVEISWKARFLKREESYHAAWGAIIYGQESWSICHWISTHSEVCLGATWITMLMLMGSLLRWFKFRWLFSPWSLAKSWVVSWFVNCGGFPPLWITATSTGSNFGRLRVVSCFWIDLRFKASRLGDPLSSPKLSSFGKFDTYMSLSVDSICTC